MEDKGTHSWAFLDNQSAALLTAVLCQRKCACGKQYLAVWLAHSFLHYQSLICLSVLVAVMQKMICRQCLSGERSGWFLYPNNISFCWDCFDFLELLLCYIALIFKS